MDFTDEGKGGFSKQTTMGPGGSKDAMGKPIQRSQTTGGAAFDDESFKEMQDKVSEVPLSHKETIIDTI